MNAAICGTFDPVTNGHMDMIERAASLFEQVVVILSCNSEKKDAWPLAVRLNWIVQAVRDAGLSNVTVVCESGLAAAAARKHNCSVLVRGVRNSIDLDYEQNMAIVNKRIDPGLETVIFLTKPGLAAVSSSNVRELYKYRQSLAGLVPECVRRDLEETTV